nr:MAG TPA: hypothetical protein [Caudoviricetes sp.]
MLNISLVAFLWGCYCDDSTPIFLLSKCESCK